MVIQQGVLLAASFVFYYLSSKTGEIIIFLISVLLSYFLGRGLAYAKHHAPSDALSKFIFLVSVGLCAFPLLTVKLCSMFLSNHPFFIKSLIVPLGLSYYTLQIIAYLSDCYTEKIQPETNLLRYALFISYFPHIVQGPIPRYDVLSKALKRDHRFNAQSFIKGCQLILWGYFLKMMIADKVAPAVNMLFNNSGQYVGTYVLVALVLYSIQLYTDFYSCVTICQGVSQLFGIHIGDNFWHPFFATSIKDFWRRWHISLSTWLRDYIYIPLGGNRKGSLIKHLNILIVFLISGFWHGNGIQFLIWGLLHGVYQITASYTISFRDRIYAFFKINKGTSIYNAIKRIGTFLWVSIAWVFFRSPSLSSAIQMLKNLFTSLNLWTIFGEERFTYGLDIHDWIVLLCSIGVLIFVSAVQEKQIAVREVIAKQPLIIRWGLYLLAISVIWVFGTYGFGYNAADFIYGGF